MRASVQGLGTELEHAIAEALRAHGHELGQPADFVVVGVHISGGNELAEITRDGWEATVGAARNGFFAMQRAARSLVERGVPGRIVVVAPIHLVRTSRRCGPAAIVGSFLATAAQVAAVELGPNAVRVNVLAVGPLENEAPATAVGGIPLGRLVRPEDVASACALLASPEAEFFNGVVLPVDGGYAVTKAAGGSPFISSR